MNRFAQFWSLESSSRGRGSGSLSGSGGQSKELFDLLSQSLRFNDGSKASGDLTVLVDQDLLEVPLDVTGDGRLNRSVDGRLLLAVDVNLVHHGELSVELVLSELLDAGADLGFLSTELVAREGDDGKALLGELRLELLKSLVLRRKSALGGDVDEEGDLALEDGKGGGFAIDVVDGVLVDAHVLWLGWNVTSQVLEEREVLKGTEDGAEHVRLRCE